MLRFANRDACRRPFKAFPADLTVVSRQPLSAKEFLAISKQSCFRSWMPPKRQINRALGAHIAAVFCQTLFSCLEKYSGDECSKSDAFTRAVVDEARSSEKPIAQPLIL